MEALVAGLASALLGAITGWVREWLNRRRIERLVEAKLEIAALRREIEIQQRVEEVRITYEGKLKEALGNLGAATDDADFRARLDKQLHALGFGTEPPAASNPPK